ncbi:MAG: glycosyltransferase [bacterium]
MVILILKIYIIFISFLTLLYILRHLIFTYNRAFTEQKVAYNDVIDSELPYVSVLIPMHNEEKVAKNILEALINSEYPKDKLEIIPINDHSTDKTKEILDEYSQKFPYIKPLHRLEEDKPRGKPAGLNEALKIAEGKIVVIYDADYIPSKGQIRDLVINFLDPEVGAVMGRVVPLNVSKNLLTRMLDLERSAGYQVDQQARYNLDLIPQYGGTVGAFRKDLLLKICKQIHSEKTEDQQKEYVNIDQDSIINRKKLVSEDDEEKCFFDPIVLAEDTEITFRFFINGYKVLYINKAECYEESPEDWKVRAKQIRRWSAGHNQVLFKYLLPLWKSENLNLLQKMDGTLLLIIYLFPFLMLLGIIDSLILFFLGEMEILSIFWILLAILAYNSYGNFAPFFQIGISAMIDGYQQRIRLLPFFYFIFLFNLWYTSLGFIDALKSILLRKSLKWDKTERFRKTT